MQIIKYVFIGLSLLLVIQLVYPMLTILLALAFGKERTKQIQTPPILFDYGCIITAYRNAAIAEPLVQSLLRQQYPHLHIYLVADECPDLDVVITDPRFTLLKPAAPLRLKAKSIIHAIENFQRNHDYIAVFDADNLAHPDFLSTINVYANAGHRCIQGQRKAKNLDSTYAALDSMGEHYKNYIERYVPYLLGGSSVISGSGMATESALYQAYLNSPAIKDGQNQWKKMLQEDKILQNFLIWRGEKIAYARKSMVYDEKVETGAAVETQRSRWLFSYFQNLPNSSGLLLKGLGRLNLNQAYFGFVTLVLPMFIQLAMAGVLAVVGLLIAPVWSLALCLAVVIFILGILLALRLDEAPQPIWDALGQVPRFVVRQFGGLFKMRDPNKHFKHTEHTRKVDLDDVLRGEKGEL